MSSAASTFAKWYISRLKSNPIMTNMGSALVLMTAGDMLAQQMEVCGFSDKEASTTSNATTTVRTDFDMHRYGTSGPREVSSVDTNNIVAMRSAIHPPSHPLTMASSSLATASSIQEEAVVAAANTMSTLRDGIQESLWFWNPFRTGTMIAWSVGAYTPFYVMVYRMYDRFLPKKSPLGVASRVGMSFLLSMPTNAVFYMYGTAVNHTMEWMAIEQEWKYELEDMGVVVQPNQVVDLPFDWEALWAKCHLKLENELETTIKTSAQFWIPINLLTFTVIPAHLQPLSLMFFSMFWNCYLSLSQHRDMALPQREEEESQQLLKLTEDQ